MELVLNHAKVRQPGIPGFQQAQQESEPDECSPSLAKAKANDNDTPSQTNPGQKDSRPDLAAKHRHRRLEQHVSDEEAECDQGVSIAHVEFEIDPHSGDGSIGDVLSIHETDAVHQAESGDETPIDAVTDLLLFFRRVPIEDGVAFESMLVEVRAALLQLRAISRG